MGEGQQKKHKVKPKYRFRIAAKREGQPAADIPPFTIRQILNLCWGMTLRLSHDDNQKSFGEEFKLVGDEYQILKGYLESKSAESSQSPSNEKEGAMKEKQFTEQVMMAMVKTFRNLGLAREAHVSWVDYQAKRYQNERKFLNEISSLTSTEGDGMFAKIVETIGGGAITTLAVILGIGQPNETPETEIPTAPIGNMDYLARLNNDVGTINNAAANMKTLAENLKSLIGSDGGATETNEADSSEAVNNATESTNATPETDQAVSSAIDNQNKEINEAALDMNNSLTNMDQIIQTAEAGNRVIPQNIVTGLSEARDNLASAMNTMAETIQSAAGNTANPPEIVNNLTQSLNTLTDSLETLTDTMNNAAGSMMNTATTSGDPTLTAIILIFISAGIVSLIAATAIAKLWKRYRISRIEDSLKKEAESVWMTKTRQTIVDCLFLLYKDLRLIYKMEHFFPGYHEHGFISTDDPFGIDREDKSARKIIEDEIIQPISIERSAEIPIIQGDEESDS